MADRVAAWLEPTPAEVSIVEFAPGRPSVGAVLEDSGRRTRLVLNGHIDTVPIDDLERWTIDPFEPTVRDGYLYGRGACDMKAGLTTQIAVAHHLAALGKPLKGSLVLHFAGGEECGEPGTLSLSGARLHRRLRHRHRADTAPGVASPAGPRPLPDPHQGTVDPRQPAHLGDNPVRRLRRVLEALDDYDDECARRQHPLLPGGSCTPTVLQRGVKENAVADSASCCSTGACSRARRSRASWPRSRPGWARAPVCGRRCPSSGSPSLRRRSTTTRLRRPVAKTVERDRPGRDGAVSARRSPATCATSSTTPVSRRSRSGPATWPSATA